jgi:hypothetical protein
MISEAALRAEIARRRLTPEQEVQFRASIEAMHNSTGCWFETAGKIYGKDRSQGVFTPRMNYLQAKVQAVIDKMEEMNLPVRIMGLKPRQKGSTTFFSACVYTFLRRRTASAVLIGGQYSQVKEAWGMMQTYQKHDGFSFWGNQGAINTKDGAWSHGSKLIGETAKDVLAGVGGTHQVLHGFEVARWAKHGVANSAEVLANITKAVPLLPDTMIILESTAEGACYDDKTEVLTDVGWRRFADLTGMESILTKNPETNVAYYQPEWKPQIHRYSGPMIKFETRTTNLLVTPNHKMWMARQKGPWKFTRADSVLGKTTDYRFDRAFKWNAPGLKSVTIPAYTHIQGNGFRTHEEKVIPIDVWLKFLGHWLADGHVVTAYGRKRAVLTQVKYVDEFRKSATDLALYMGCKMRESVHGRGLRFDLINAQLANYLKDYSKPKRIPRELLMGLSSEQCRDLLASVYDGDGGWRCKFGYKIDRGMIYAGIDEALVDDLQELSLKAGYATSASGPKRNRRVTYTSSTIAMVRHDNPPVEVPNYNGMVYCVTLPKHHLLMVRRNGIATWCGNSGDFYDRYVRAIDAEDFLEGKVTPQPGDYVRVFAPWFEFSDSAMRLTEEQKEDIRTTLDADPEYQGERDLIDVYGRYDDAKVLRLGTAVTEYDVWEQLAWRRYAIEKECKRSKEIFNRDYPHSWRTAFQQSGSQRFNTSGLEKIRRNRGRVTPQNGIIEISKQRVTFRPTTEGEATVTVFEKPVAGCRYILALDPMTGETQVGGLDPDQHGVFVLRAGYWDSSGKWVRAATAARIVPCRWDIDILAEHAWRLARYYGGTSGCKIVVEMNQDKGITELLKLRGADLYQREFFNQREHRLSKALGYQTNEKTRETLVEKLAEAIREWDRPDNGLDIWCPIALEQCENFVRKAKGRSEHADGWHDDDVLAIALGITLIGHATTYTPTANMFNLPPDLRDSQRSGGAVRSMYS